MSVRRLQVVLDLDTGRYTGRMSGAAAQTRAFQGSVDSSSRSVRNLGGSFGALNAQMAAPMQNLRQYTMMMGTLRLAYLAVSAVGVSWVASLVKQSATIERLTILMKGLSNATSEVEKTQEAAKNMKFLFEEARRTGFAVDALADSFVKFKAGGLDPMDGSLQSLTNAVAAFGGTSETMHRASIAIQQMAGKGVISMEELRQQLGEAVPTAIADMSRAMGMSIKDFTKLVSEGAVQAKPALELMFMEFDRLYGGAGDRLAQTFTGQIATIKTNLMELSTYFTGLSLETGRAEEGSLYDTLTKGIKELNAAMGSAEGQTFARDLGAAVGQVASAIAAAARFVVEFRNEFTILGKVAVTAFLAIKAASIFNWMAAGILGITSAMRGMSLATLMGAGTTVTAFANMTNSINVKAAAMTRLIRIRDSNVASIQREVVATGGQLNASRQRVLNLQAEQAALGRKVVAERAALAAAQQAEMVARANIATGVRLQASIAQVTAAKRAQTIASIRLAQIERNLAATTTALTQATVAETAAASANAAAIGRQTVVAGAATIGMRAYAAAMGIAAGAATFLSRAVSMVLGPLGLIAMLLYAAADAAGVFESRANRAADAAARLRAGIADIKDIEDLNTRNKELLRDQKADAEILKKGGQWITYRDADGPQQRFQALTSDQRKAIQARMQDRKREAASNFRDAQYGSRSIAETQGRNSAAMTTSAINDQLRDDEARYRKIATSGASEDEIAAAREQLAARRKIVYTNAIADAEAKAAAARARNDRGSMIAFDEQAKALRESAGMTDDVAARTAALREQAVGAGNAGADAGKKTAGGMSEAEKAAKSAAKEFENAREKYDEMIARQAGDIAQLAAEVGGAEGALAEFQARLKAGSYSDATKEEIAELAFGYAKIDELQRNKDYAKGFRELTAELARAASEAEGLWAALSMDNTGAALREFDRTEQVRSRFADKLKLAELTGDPAKVAAVNAEIQKMIDALAKIDAARAADGWREMTEEIQISLMSEEEARQANFDREMARQQELIDAIRANAAIGAQEKILAEQRFEDWRRARMAQLARENESSTIKMARDWAKLGQNIDQALGGALNSFVDGMFDAQFSFKDFAVGLIKELVKIIVKAMIAYAILSAIGMANNSSGQPVSFGDFMKGQIGAGLGGTGNAANGSSIGNLGNSNGLPPNTKNFTIAHIGGIIGRLTQSANVDPAVFAKAKTYHTGTNSIGGRALRPGEVPIIGMEGEAVLTEDQQRSISGALKAKASGNSPAPVTVNIINNSSTQLDAQQGEPEFDGREMIVNVVVEAVSKQGPLRDALSNMSAK